MDASDEDPVGLAALNRAIGIAGLGALAAGLGVDYQQIQGWRKRNRRFAAPVEWCAAIERLSGVPRWELRPDVWWSVWPELIGRPGAPAVPAEVSNG